MRKLIYIEDNFLDSSLCKPFIDLHMLKKDSLDAVTHAEGGGLLLQPNEFDQNYGAKYLGGNVDPIDLNSTIHIEMRNFNRVITSKLIL